MVLPSPSPSIAFSLQCWLEIVMVEIMSRPNGWFNDAHGNFFYAYMKYQITLWYLYTYVNQFYNIVGFIHEGLFMAPEHDSFLLVKHIILQINPLFTRRGYPSWRETWKWKVGGSELWMEGACDGLIWVDVLLIYIYIYVVYI